MLACLLVPWIETVHRNRIDPFGSGHSKGALALGVKPVEQIKIDALQLVDQFSRLGFVQLIPPGQNMFLPVLPDPFQDIRRNGSHDWEYI